jgi:hypothetical protein
MASVTQLACNHLTSPYGYLDDDFGASSAMDNISEIIVIGAPAWSNVTLPGSIHIYEATDTSINYITSIDGPSIGSGFGSAVSIDIGGDKIAVTANSISEVHIYTTNDQYWENYSTQVISKPGVEKFGHSISIAYENSNVLCIGSPSENNVYVYNDTTLVYTDTNPTDVFNYANVLVESAYTGNKIISSHPTEIGRFGRSVSISGDYAIVGALGENPNDISRAGSAYIYKRNGDTWTEQTKLVAGDPGQSDNFGYSVAISGDYAIVGAYQEDPNDISGAGSAYIFKRNGDTWTQQTKLVADDKQQSDLFGWSVAIDGDYAIVGARGEDPDGNSSAGAAYIFKRIGDTWTQQTKLVAGDKQPGDNFGDSVAISGDYAIVGAYAEDPDGNSNAGAAYIYTRNGTTWSQQQKIQAGDGADSDNFGCSVSLSGDYAIVGARFEDPGNPELLNAGSAYIFKLIGDTWTQQTKLVADDKQPSDNFGVSVSIIGDYAIVGANGDDSYTGAAYIFKRIGDTWTQQTKLVAGDPEQGDYFGWSVAIGGDYAIVGAQYKYNDVPEIPDAGSAYIYIFKGIYSPVQLIPQYNQYGFSVSMSGDGTTFIAGAPGTQSNVYNGYGVGYTSPGLDDISNRDNYYNYQSGFARIVYSEGADWANTTTKIGDQTLLVGDKNRFEVDKYSAFGYSTCTNSDGSIVAVGIPGDSGFAAFSYNILNDTWERAGDITLSDLGMGTTISMTYNGNRVCVGSSFEFTKYFGNSSGERKKLYQIYDYNELYWSAYNPFDEIFSESGFTTSMSKNGLFILNSGNMSDDGIIKGGVNAEVVRLATTVKILGNTTVGGNLAVKNIIVGGGIKKTFPDYSGEIIFSDTPGDATFQPIIRNWNFKNDNIGGRVFNNSNTYTSSELLIHKGGEYPDKLGAWGREPDRIRLQSRSIVLDTSYTDDTDDTQTHPKFVLDTFGKIGINLPELQPDSLLIRDGFGPYKENIKARLDVNGTTTIRNKLDVNYRLKSNVTIGKQTIAFYDTRDLNCVDTNYLYDAGPREINNNKLTITNCTYDTGNFGISINSGGSLTGTLNELGRNKAISFWLMLTNEQSTYPNNLIFYIGDTVIDDGFEIVALSLFYNSDTDKGIALHLIKRSDSILKFQKVFEPNKWHHIYFEIEGIYNFLSSVM